MTNPRSAPADAYDAANARLRGDRTTETLHDARVGRDGEWCDNCAGRILPHALCFQTGNGILYCRSCAATFTRNAERTEMERGDL